jgi:N-methylhydantoinase A
LMDRYLARLEQELPQRVALRIMQSNGGSIASETARQVAARTLLSGPAAGVVGAAFVGELAGFRRLITLDIGGTSTDVALVDGEISEATDGKIGGYPTRLPMIDIHTVGAGGGSIAWFDVGGALRVGPGSVGAQPGPAAYGRGGTEATVTDANVVLGRLIPGAFLGGGMQLDAEEARRAVGRIAERLGSSVEEAAWGIVRIVNANMEGAMRVISVQRGNDPRDFVLTAFGGAGPLHACELAEALRIPRVLVPGTPGVLSALGMLAADVVKDYVRTVMVSASEALQVVDKVSAELEARGREELAREGMANIVVEHMLDMRYVGQSYELGVTFTGGIERAVEGFHDLHEKRFGYSDREERVEVVNVRIKARGIVTHPVLERQEEMPEVDVEAKQTRMVGFAGNDGVVMYETGVYERASLVAGTRVQGPAIVTQYDTTTVIAPHWWARVDALGNIIMERKAQEQ